jgi:hypothetical protein
MKPKPGKAKPAHAPIPLKLTRKQLGNAFGRVAGYGTWLKK